MPPWLEWFVYLPDGWGALIGAAIGLGGVAWATSRSYRHLIHSQEHQAKLALQREERAHIEQQLRLTAALMGEIEGLGEMAKSLLRHAIAKESALAESRAKGDPERSIPISIPVSVPDAPLCGARGEN